MRHVAARDRVHGVQVEPDDRQNRRVARLAAPRRLARAACGRALDVALPPLCPSCREPVGDNGLCAACWSKLSLHRAALLRAARHSVCLRSRAGPAVDAGDRRSAGLPPRARRGALRRRRPRPGACASNTATGSTSRPTMGRWMAQCRARAVGRGRRAGAGAAALAAAVGAAVQPVGAARRGHFAGKPASGRRTTAAQARQGDAAAGRAVTGRARRKRAGRLPRAARRARPRSPAAGSSWSTTC